MEKNVKHAQFSVDIEIPTDHKEYKFEIGVYLFKEGTHYIAYAPALDLSSYSDSFNGSISAFYEAFQLYIEYCIEHKTLKANLVDLGWRIQNSTIETPSTTQLRSNQTLNSLLNGHCNYQYMISPVAIPAYAL